MPRPRTRPIKNDYVREIMDALDCDNFVELEDRTGISATTWSGWAYNQRDPIPSLNLVERLMKATGQSVEELKVGFEKAKHA